jgi:UDP-2,4-diacetamido-2,4,6-trideoxy-beta-L-altropyranose hydrolase
MNETIMFRVDSSLEIGTGHVMRCLTLANFLASKDFHSVFVSRDLPANISNKITHAGHELRILPRPTSPNEVPQGTLAHAAWLMTSQEKDLAQTLQACQDISPNWVIVDHYAIDRTWEDGVQQAYPNAKILIIDDLADRKHRAHILLDQNLGRRPQDYSDLVPEECKLLLGPQYAILRSEFAEYRAQSLSRRKNIKNISSILINMGGGDKLNTSEKILRVIKECNLHPKTNITVILGPQFQNKESIILCAENMTYKTDILFDVANMAETLSNADLAIGAAGSSCWERCTLGLPSMLLVLADNQTDIAQNLGKLKCAISLGNINENSWKKLLQETLSKITIEDIQKIGTNSEKICSGDGVSKLRLEMLQYAN